MPTDLHNPPRPSLDPTRRRAMLDAVLAEPEPPRRRPRPLLAPLSTAAAVVLLVAGGTGLLLGQGAPPSDPGAERPDSSFGRAGDEPVGEAEARRVLRVCGKNLRGFAGRDALPRTFDVGGPFDVYYARRLSSATHWPVLIGQVPDGTVVVGQDADGTDGFACIGGGISGSFYAPDGIPSRPPPDGRAVRSLGIGGGGAGPAPGEADGRTWWEYDELYRVSPRVAAIESRAVVDGEPEPWRSSREHGGWVYVIRAAPVDPATGSIQLELRAVDSDGQVVDSGDDLATVAILIRRTPTVTEPSL